jgi:hypothetical protein
MEILGKLLGNPARVKIMRLFLLNKQKTFSIKDVVKRSRVTSPIARREMKLLTLVGFLKKRPNDYAFNFNFKYATEFDGLLASSDLLDKDAVLSIFKKSGKVKLLAVAGIFIKNLDSRVDVLIVGDNLKRGKIEEGIRKLEAEIGTELSYAVFETKEFLYRVNMYDKLVRDILDFPHEVLLQGRELSTSALKKA